MAQLDGGDQSVVLVVRWHPHIDDRDIGAVGQCLVQQVFCVSCLGDHVEPGVGQEPGDAFAEQHVVLTDDDPQSRLQLGCGHRAQRPSSNCRSAISESSFFARKPCAPARCAAGPIPGSVLAEMSTTRIGHRNATRCSVS